MKITYNLFIKDMMSKTGAYCLVAQRDTLQEARDFAQIYNAPYRIWEQRGASQQLVAERR